MEINTSAWHYKFYRLYKLLRREHFRNYISDTEITKTAQDRYFNNYLMMPSNFCEYWRGVLLWPAINFSISLAIYGTLLFMIGTLLFSHGGSLAIGFFALAVALVIVVSGFYLVNSILEWLNNKKENLKENKYVKDTFVYEIYKNTKSTICPMIEYKKDAE